MPLPYKKTFLAFAVSLSVLSCGAVSDRLGKSEPSNYVVRDPMAGYFDFAERREIMRTSTDPVLTETRSKLLKVSNCAKIQKIPVQNQPIVLPSFYGDKPAWRVAVRPFWDIENASSKLAAANLIADDRRYADCLMTTLTRWAKQDGLADFAYDPKKKQGWFQVEATLFSMALALAAIRPDVAHRKDELAYIDAWLKRVAKSHFAIGGEPEGTCCNNHFYRRALYAAMIGVMTNDNDLFNKGVGAIRSALNEATSDGALPLEMARGPLAAHYQNYAVMYLVMIAEIAERQGYPVWEMKVRGKTLRTLVKFNTRILADPNVVLKHTDAQDVTLRYRNDFQYFAWIEIYLSRYKDPALERWVKDHRPLYNRSLGGNLTAYFYTGG